MSEHTPGPWLYRPQKWDDWGWVRSQDGELVAAAKAGREVSNEEYSHHRHAKTDPYEANARLIAAAPDFYHAATTGAQVNLPDFLEWIAARLIRFGDSPNVDFVVTLRDRAKLLRAAIAKAENRS